MAIMPFWKQIKGLSGSFGKYSDDEVANEQLSAVIGEQVDFTSTPLDDPEISCGQSLVTRSINQRQCDQAQVMVGPWVSQTLARSIL